MSIVKDTPRNNISLKNSDNVGVLKDERWDLANVHECGFCLKHGEYELLLEYTERLMCSDDFNISGAQVKLEVTFQEYQSHPCHANGSRKIYFGWYWWRDPGEALV